MLVISKHIIFSSRAYLFRYFIAFWMARSNYIFAMPITASGTSLPTLVFPRRRPAFGMPTRELRHGHEQDWARLTARQWWTSCPTLPRHRNRFRLRAPQTLAKLTTNILVHLIAYRITIPLLTSIFFSISD